MSETDQKFIFEAGPELAGQRLDRALADLIEGHSRSAIQQWLKNGLVRVDGDTASQKHRLRGGETLVVTVPAPEPADWPAQPLPLEILYQDDSLFVINKPAGMVVHPGAGNPDGTLLNGLLYQDESLATLPRAGIVHRLDKDTTGLLVVARNEVARQSLIEQLQARTMKREYIAVVNGVMVAGETIDRPIGRNRYDRLRMCVTGSGKPAVTHVRVTQKFRSHCRLAVALDTGRTHQIRVHLSWRDYPIVGDPLYGGRVRLPPGADDALIEAIQGFQRQALHATRLSLSHPRSGDIMSWEQDLPADMVNLLEQLAEDARRHNGAGV